MAVKHINHSARLEQALATSTFLSVDPITSSLHYFIQNTQTKKSANLVLSLVDQLASFSTPNHDGGAGRDRTDDPLLAKQVLSQLSYSPLSCIMVGLGGLEPPTPRLSSVCSNQLSYKPLYLHQLLPVSANTGR